MTAEDLAKRIRAGQAPILLDVRSGFEFSAGHIQGAVHAPLAGLLKTVRSVTDDKGSPLVITCEHGPRAQLAVALIKMFGYQNVELLDGHMARWRQAGHPVQKGRQ